MNPKVDIHKVFADYFTGDIIQNIAYACSKKLSEGHTCLDLDEYNLEQDKTISAETLIKNSAWITDKEELKNAFVIKNNKVYLQRYFAYETEIIDSIQKLIKTEDFTEKAQLLKEKKALISEIFELEKDTENWQFVSAILAYLNNFSIITGGPGTGKTTTIAKFLALVYSINPKAKVALAAPTGKAAARMKESILFAKSQLNGINDETKSLFERISSSTIHRLLGYRRGTHYFKHNAKNPLAFDLVIVDESSMIGLSLMAKLLAAVPTNKQIVLLGDKDQLSSVEAGSVFGDICQSLSNLNSFSTKKAKIINQFSDFDYQKFAKDEHQNLISGHITKLLTSYRFDNNSGIGNISKSVLNGTLSVNKIKPESKDLKIIEDYDKNQFEHFYQLYQNYISEQDTLLALHEFSKTRVLCPTKEGEYSVDYFNREIEVFLKSKGYLSPNFSFYHNQPIIITRNDYQLKLFNGDIGLIREDIDGRLQAYFEAEDGSLKSISTNFISHYKTVFAMTIHKSQGSEFEHVAVVLPKHEELEILSKELLYTALTRAKDSLWIFAKAQLLEAVSQKPVQRASGIAERINQL